MTAGAMILGMIPMALGIGEGGEQNAPLARAVIGGLLFATFATLVFVPTVYRLLRRAPAGRRTTQSNPGEPLAITDTGRGLQRAAVVLHAVMLLLAFLIVHLFTIASLTHALARQIPRLAGNGASRRRRHGHGKSGSRQPVAAR